MVWVLLLLAQSASAQQEQIDRGQALYRDEKAGCIACHALKGEGKPIGPDLKGIARLSPQAIAMAVRSTATQYVQIVKLKSGEQFPAMPGAKDEKTVQMFDLTQTPPVERKVDKDDVVSMTGNDKWKHPPAAAKISPEQLAGIVAYIRYAATGAKKSVSPDDVH
jgi:mono/diheme cytochrome c family protein